MAVHCSSTIWVGSRDVEEVDASEDYEEAGEQRQCVDGIGCVEAAIKDEGSAKGRCRKCYVVDGIDTVDVSLAPR